MRPGRGSRHCRHHYSRVPRKAPAPNRPLVFLLPTPLSSLSASSAFPQSTVTVVRGWPLRCCVDVGSAGRSSFSRPVAAARLKAGQLRGELSQRAGAAHSWLADGDAPRVGACAC